MYIYIHIYMCIRKQHGLLFCNRCNKIGENIRTNVLDPQKMILYIVLIIYSQIDKNSDSN